MNEIILEKTPVSTREMINKHVEHLEDLVRDNRKNTENVQRATLQLQDRVDN